MELKKIFLSEVEKLTEGYTDIAITLSSGIDSNAVMFALLELGKKPHAYTFHVEGIDSQDFIYAKKNSNIFNIPFTECVIPYNINIDIIKKIINSYKLKKKTEIECFYPYFYLLPKVKENILALGLAADLYFCLSKKGMIHYREPLSKLQKFRNDLFKVTKRDVIVLNKISEEFNKNLKIVDPFEQQNIFDFFYNKEWKEINKPHQKQSILDMFPNQFNKIKIFNHTNLQCGDSKIRDIFIPLLKDKTINYKSRKRMIDLYRDISIESNQLSI